MQLFKKILLFVSAFIPLYFLLLTKIAIELANGNLHFDILNSVMLGFLFLLCGLGVLGIVWTKATGKNKKIEILHSKNVTENYFLNYFTLFVLFALTFEIQFISMAVSFVLILVFVGVVYIKNNMFRINPTLCILGFSLFDIVYSENGKEKNVFIFSRAKIERGTLIDVCLWDLSIGAKTD